MKKLILFFLTFCMVVTMVFASPMQILAAGEGNTVLVMKGKENSGTREIEIDVTVEENTGVCGMLLSLVYDTSVFTLTDLEYGTAFSSLLPIHTNTETEEGYGIYPFKITYLGEQNDISTGKMMTLRFRVKDDAPGGNYTITLKYERDQDVTYLKGNEILAKNLLIDGVKITLSENQVVNIDTVTNRKEESDVVNKINGLWLPVVIGGLVLIGSCFLFTSVLINRKKSKKWNKI